MFVYDKQTLWYSVERPRGVLQSEFYRTLLSRNGVGTVADLL